MHILNLEQQAFLAENTGFAYNTSPGTAGNPRIGGTSIVDPKHRSKK
jgi:hypothetical protein